MSDLSPYHVTLKSNNSLIYSMLNCLSAEEEGFEPPEPCGSTVFKTAALDRSATPLYWSNYFIYTRNLAVQRFLPKASLWGKTAAFPKGMALPRPLCHSSLFWSNYFFIPRNLTADDLRSGRFRPGSAKVILKLF